MIDTETPVYQKVLLKKLNALAMHKVRKEEFLKTREKIIRDIEEAREIWIKTLEQLPKQEF
ncbi:MAG: hypothetical protein HXX09_08345 [Bacteroidetes bacterium]|nr:hypothetical protein [Bacteroidota bacterium]